MHDASSVIVERIRALARDRDIRWLLVLGSGQGLLSNLLIILHRYHLFIQVAHVA